MTTDTENLTTELRNAYRLASKTGCQVTDGEINDIVANHFPTAHRVDADSDAWNLGNGEQVHVRTSWGESAVPELDVWVDLAPEVRADLVAGAEQRLEQEVAEAITWLATKAPDVDLTSEESILDAFDGSHIRSDSLGNGSSEEWGIEVGLDSRTGRLMLGAWCWDVREREASDTMAHTVDVAAAVTAARLAAARDHLTAAEAMFADEAAAAQTAGAVTWQEVAGLLGVKDRQGAQAWVARHRTAISIRALADEMGQEVEEVAGMAVNLADFDDDVFAAQAPGPHGRMVNIGSLMVDTGSLLTASAADEIRANFDEWVQSFR